MMMSSGSKCLTHPSLTLSRPFTTPNPWQQHQMLRWESNIEAKIEVPEFHQVRMGAEAQKQAKEKEKRRQETGLGQDCLDMSMS